MNTTTTFAVKGIDLIGYFTADPNRAIAFYREKLGLVPTEIDKEGRGAEFTLADGTTFGVWQDADAPVPGAAVMFAVDDIASAVSVLRERGVQLDGPMESPVCHMAFGKDPDGNPFIVHQRKT